MTDLPTLEAAYLAADAARTAAQETFFAALKAAHPFQPGDTVTGDGGKLGRVEKLGIEYSNWEKKFSVYVKGKILRKDGSVGTREIQLWEIAVWRNMRKVPS